MTATSVAPAPSLAERVVSAIAARFGRHDVSRRRFLFRLAVVGSALSVNPLQYLLRPVSAYASVCGSGASCGSGWTAFCCTVNDPSTTGQPRGANTCPDYSYVAGWWKVNASAFCHGAPRYYVDCNSYEECAPESQFDACEARCANGPCDHRRWCTNCFRYGQCNTQVRATGRVVCRIITCTPPWEWDPACSTTVRTSNTTRTHSASCLPRTYADWVDLHYQDLGLTGSVVGSPVTSTRDTERGGSRRLYSNGAITSRGSKDTTFHIVGRFDDEWRAAGSEGGSLGYPLALATSISGGSWQRFETGAIVARGSNTHSVGGIIGRRYLELGGPQGRWGFPTQDVSQVAGGSMGRFDSATVYATEEHGVFTPSGSTLSAYQAAGGPSGDLGFPISDEVRTVDGRHRTSFEGGAILRSGSSTQVLLLPDERPPSQLPSAPGRATPGGRPPSQLP